MYYPIVVLSHCCSSANVIEPREPHTCNNTVIYVKLGVLYVVFFWRMCDLYACALSECNILYTYALIVQ
jgi:hypothetical protein